MPEITLQESHDQLTSAFTEVVRAINHGRLPDNTTLITAALALRQAAPLIKPSAGFSKDNVDVVADDFLGPYGFGRLFPTGADDEAHEEAAPQPLAR
jgi:hypothetical protein